MKAYFRWGRYLRTAIHQLSIYGSAEQVPDWEGKKRHTARMKNDLIGNCSAWLCILKDWRCHKDQGVSWKGRCSNRTFLFKCVVFREDVQNQRMVIIIDVCNSFIDILDRDDRQNGTKNLSAVKLSKSSCIERRRGIRWTYSLMSESLNGTSFTAVGAINLVASSCSPPNTILPWVLSKRPLMRLKAWVVTSREQIPGVDTESGKNLSRLGGHVSYITTYKKHWTYAAWSALTNLSWKSLGTNT